MGQVPHAAHDTHAVRAALQRSKAPLKELAAQHKLTAKTVSKGGSAPSFIAARGPKAPHSTVLTPHRMRPAEGAAMHWSRFVDAPIAALILALRTWFDAATAERIVVAFWPPLVLAVHLGLTAVGRSACSIA